ncbi:hypothetical protein PAMP_020265 [Pampus punctatissimus]
MKSATPAICRIKWSIYRLKSINSLVSSRADLQYIGITGWSYAALCLFSILFIIPRSEKTHKELRDEAAPPPPPPPTPLGCTFPPNSLRTKQPSVRSKRPRAQTHCSIHNYRGADVLGFAGKKVLGHSQAVSCFVSLCCSLFSIMLCVSLQRSVQHEA